MSFQDRFEDSRIIGGLVQVDQGSHFDITVLHTVALFLHGNVATAVCVEPEPGELVRRHPIHCCFVLFIDSHFLYDQFTEEDSTPVTHDVDVRLFTYLIPYTVKVLGIEVNITFTQMTRKSHEGRKVTIPTIQLITVLGREVDTSIGDIDICAIRVRICVLHNLIIEEVLICITTTVIIHRNEGTTLTTIIHIRRVGETTADSNI